MKSLGNHSFSFSSLFKSKPKNTAPAHHAATPTPGTATRGANGLPPGAAAPRLGGDIAGTSTGDSVRFAHLPPGAAAPAHLADSQPSQMAVPGGYSSADAYRGAPKTFEDMGMVRQAGGGLKFPSGQPGPAPRNDNMIFSSTPGVANTSIPEKQAPTSFEQMNLVPHPKGGLRLPDAGQIKPRTEGQMFSPTPGYTPSGSSQAYLDQARPEGAQKPGGSTV